MARHTKNVAWFVLLLVIILAGLIFSLSSKKGDSSGSAKTTNGSASVESTSAPNDYVSRLSKALSDKGVVMYGSYSDDLTKQQEKLFGDAFANIDYVECDAQGSHPNPDECIANNVSTYPTWIYQEKSYSGVQSLADLAKIITFSDNTN